MKKMNELRDKELAARERRDEGIGAVFGELVHRLGVFRRELGLRGVGL